VLDLTRCGYLYYVNLYLFTLTLTCLMERTGCGVGGFGSRIVGISSFISEE